MIQNEQPVPCSAPQPPSREQLHKALFDIVVLWRNGKVFIDQEHRKTFEDATDLLGWTATMGGRRLPLTNKQLDSLVDLVRRT